MLTIDAIRRRLTAESGFTLTELMVAIALSSFVLLGVMHLMSAGGRAGARVTDKSETIPRMRAALDAATRVLRTQVCPTYTTPPITSGTPTSITFYSDTNTSTAFRPRKVTISLLGSEITQQTWVPTNTASPWTYNTTPTQTRVLAEGVGAISGTPFLSYYTATNALAMSTPLDPSLTGTSRPPNSVTKVAKVSVAFRAAALSGRTGKAAETAQTGDVIARNIDLSGTSNGQGLQCGA